MKRKNLTRNALFTSIISLLLCVSMLVGTTFAWFTDEVVSDVNTIASGNLDVELYHSNKTDKGERVSSATVLFDDVTLWEPGAVAYENFVIANEGTLALKYQMTLNALNATETPEGKTLADVLQVAIVDGGFNGGRTEAHALQNYTSLSSFTLDGELKGDTKSKTYGVVVYWRPDTNHSDGNYDNEFNVQGGLKIDLGISLFATQEMHENDSFGSDYDGLVWDKALKVMSEAELIAALENGETMIMLEEDIALTNALVIPEGATVALNLNGKKIDISAAYDSNNADASSAIANYGNLTMVGNGTIKATNNYTVRNNGTMVIDGVTIENGVMNFGDLTVNSGNISNSRSGKHTIYGNNAKLTINGGVFYNGNPGNAAIFSNDGEVEIKGGEFSIADGTATQGWTSCLLDAQGNAKFTINGGVVNGEIRDYNKNTTVYGGTFSHSSVKNFVAPGYKAVEKNGQYVVVSENAIANSDDLIAAINAAKDGDTLLLAPGEYSLRFTNDTAFNVDNLNIKGMDNAKLTVSSSEAWYGRVQGDNVTFENIHFTSSVGATGKATYNNCTFDDWTICASSGNKETYFNNCDINGTLNTSTDFSSGNTYVTDSTVAKAEFSGAATMYFTNCQIGELISWDMATVLENCVVEKQDLKMEDQKVTTIETDENGLSWATNTANPDALVLYLVPSDYAETTLAVPEGATAIGNYAFKYNSNVKTVNLPTTVTDLGRGFDSSSVKKVVLNEGLKTISSRAFKSTSALVEVVIPSTVTTIADDAFQKTGLKTITIPATVEYVGAQAFGASKIETVIFEGDITIQNKAFRGCENLRTVYINGDDITFENTTGEANCWFCNSESSNPNTSEITFHVKNESVAAKVKAAMGKDIEKVVILVNDVPYEG